MNESTIDAQRSVVAGVDGSSHGLDAVAWAAREAVSRDEPLRLIHAFAWPLVRMPGSLYSMGPAGGLRSQAYGFLDEAVKTAQDTDPRVRVEPHLEEAFPTPLLIAESESASRVVVGTRGWGGISGLIAGSTATSLAAHAHSPVVVVRKAAEPENSEALRPVVVGIDGSETGARALAAAVEMATRHGRALVAVNVRKPSDQDVEVIERAMAPWRERFPDLPIEERLLTGHPVGVLAEQSAEAYVLVVGSHGRGGFRGMLLGSVSQSLLQHARCPLMVVPPRATPVEP